MGGVVDKAKIIAERGVYTEAEIKIDNVLWRAHENRNKSVFTLQRREIVVGTR